MRQTLAASREDLGFTIIELVIVMAMTAIIATITLANYRAGEKQKRVSLAADGITSALSLAQTYAVSGKQTNNSNAACRVPQYYYLLLSSLGTYTLYGYDNCSQSTGAADVMEIFTLPSNTRVKSGGLVLDGTTAASSMQIAVYPPYGKIKALVDAGSYATFGTAQITIETTDGSVSKTVTVDGVAGRIGQ